MRQRANIIRTLIYSPKVMLMDEPFGPLDAQTRVILQDQLLDIWNRTGVTIIFITHDLHEAIGLGDRVVLLSARPGRIIRVDKVGMSRPARCVSHARQRRFRELYDAIWVELERQVRDQRKCDRATMEARDARCGISTQSQAERRARQRYRRRVTIGQICPHCCCDRRLAFRQRPAVRSVFRRQPGRRCQSIDQRSGRSRLLQRPSGDRNRDDLGLSAGALSGIALGLLFARWRLAADIFDPFFTGLNSLPRIALAPLLVIWFGIDMASKVVLAATLVFFLTFFTTLTGIRNVDPALVDVARLVGANERQIFRYVMLPGAAAWVINGLKMSLPYALIGVIVGEFLVASSGLGYRLNFYSTSYNTNGTFAMLLVMMALMMGLNALMGLLERYALRWRAER